MVNAAGKYARDALRMLEEYCEFIEEQNLTLLKENEKLKEQVRKYEKDIENTGEKQ